MEHPKIDLAKKTLRMEGKKYWWKTESNSSHETVRVWYTDSKKHFYLVEDDCSDDEKMTIEEIEESERQLGGERLDYKPAEHRIKTRKTLKRLDKLVDRAEAEQEEQEAKERKSSSHSSEDPAEQHHTRPKKKAEDTNNHERVTERASRKSSISFALKSDVSDYVLNIRVAPSKKQKGLYNVSIHLGSKFLGYVEVPLERVVELGRRLRRLGRAT